MSGTLPFYAGGRIRLSGPLTPELYVYCPQEAESIYCQNPVPFRRCTGYGTTRPCEFYRHEPGAHETPHRCVYGDAEGGDEHA